MYHYNRGYIVTRGTVLSQAAFLYEKKTIGTPRFGFVFIGQEAQ